MDPSNETDLPLWKLAEKTRQEQTAKAAAAEEDAPLRKPEIPIEERLEGTTSQEELNRVFQSSLHHRILRFSFSEEYQRDVRLPLERMATKISEQPHLDTHPDALQRIHGHEKDAHQAFSFAADKRGPVALIEEIKSRFTTFTRENHKYLQMMFGNLEPERNILRDIHNSFFEGSGLTLRDIERKDIPKLMARGTFSVPPHPKELLLEAIITQSPDLKNGGRVLVISDHPVTAKYLAMKASEWPRVSRAERALGPGVSEKLNDRDSAYSQPDGDIEVYVLTRAQLKNIKGKNGISGVHAAVTVVHDLAVNQNKSTHSRRQTQDPNPFTKPDKSDLPWLFSESFIELSHRDQRLVPLSRALDMNHPSILDED